MPLVKEVSVKVTATGVEDAKLKIDRIRVAAKELAEQRPEITPQIDATKALLEARLLKAGIRRELAGSLGGGGTQFSLGQSLTEGSGILGNPVAFAGVASAVAAAAVEVVGLVNGLAAAAAGVGAFGLLALPTLNKVKDAYTNIGDAQKKFNSALALEKEFPTKAHAAAAQRALENLKVAQEAAGPGISQAVSGVQALVSSFEKMATGFQPVVLRVFGDTLKIANTLLPDLLPFARDAGGAIDGLLQRVNRFFQSANFQAWLAKFRPLVGPAITAIGNGIGQLGVAIGHLLTIMDKKDVVRAIDFAFGALKWTIFAVTGSVQLLMKEFDIAKTAIVKSLKAIVDGAALAFGWLPGLGPALKNSQKQFDAWTAGVTGDLAVVGNAALGAAGKLAVAINTAATAAAIASGHPAGQGPGNPKLGHLAAGGVSAGGWTVVGETGPEYVQLPAGSTVYSNAASRQMSGSGGGVTIVVQPGKMGGLDRMFMSWLKQNVRVGGGDPGILGR